MAAGEYFARIGTRVAAGMPAPAVLPQATRLSLPRDPEPAALPTPRPLTPPPVTAPAPPRTLVPDPAPIRVPELPLAVPVPEPTPIIRPDDTPRATNPETASPAAAIRPAPELKPDKVAEPAPLTPVSRARVEPAQDPPSPIPPETPAPAPVLAPPAIEPQPRAPQPAPLPNPTAPEDDPIAAFERYIERVITEPAPPATPAPVTPRLDPPAPGLDPAPQSARLEIGQIRVEVVDDRPRQAANGPRGGARRGGSVAPARATPGRRFGLGQI